MNALAKITLAKITPAQPIVRSAAERVGRYDWKALAAELSSYGCAVINKLLTGDECRDIAALYPREEHFRSHIHMARHGFGRGEYRYFKYPARRCTDPPEIIAPGLGSKTITARVPARVAGL